ncbi:MAG: glycosyltransferase [Clostridia bacterium]|nr:glycosyltransferase [Deltaproteobacteria bacterium]
MKPYIVWLGPLVDEATLLAGYAVSPAAVRWQTGFIRGLAASGVRVVNAGHIGEPAWPRGRLRMSASLGAVPQDIDGQLVGYVNVPIARAAHLTLNYGRAVHSIVRHHGRPMAIVTYNFYQPLAAVAFVASRFTGAPWILISADRDPGLYATTIARLPDGTVYLSWGEYDSGRRAKFHLDGGINQERPSAPATPPRVVYTGALTAGAGVELLAAAFDNVKRRDVELWICGKGKNAVVEQLARRDPRVRYKGLVGDEELAAICASAAIFVNPRLPDLEENKYNFPSKVLDYLAAGAPIVSTWTDGFAPEYRDLLKVVPATPTDFARGIEETLALPDEERTRHAVAARAFALASRSWPRQAARFVTWAEALASGRA